MRKPAWVSLFLFSGVVLIHSLFSYPFPKVFGISELVVGAFLLAYTVHSFNRSLVTNSRGAFKVTLVTISMVYLLVVPFVLTMVHDWPVRNVVRDFFPLTFLFLPFLVLEHRLSHKLIAFICALGGAFLSIRYYVTADVNLALLGKRMFPDSFMVYSYDPLVLFGAIYAFSRALEGSWVSRIISSAISVACLVALFGVFQRAPIAMFLASVALLAVYGRHFKFSMVRTLLVAAVVLVIVLYQSDYLAQLFYGLEAKQAEAGLNSKDAEFFDIIRQLDNPAKVWFGVGWGGIFYSSAYGRDYWNTHSAVTYFLIKSGVLGLTFFLFLMGMLARRLMEIIRVDFGLFLACIMPLLVGLLFQPTYKTMTYGLVVVVALSARQPLQRSVQPALRNHVPA